MEAKLQKLKVTELKELLAKHHLVQTGKKDDLIKRLLDHNISVDDEIAEELEDPDAPAADQLAPETSAASSAAPVEASSSKAPAPATQGGNDEVTSTSTDELTPEQKAMKARAERFGIPFTPNPTPKANKPQSKSASANSAPNGKSAPSSSNTKAEATAKKEKAGAIDSTNLGISQDILDKRAAKFGIPEKKDSSASASNTAPPAEKAKAVKPESKKKEEISPEMAEKIAVEEEKKRKRAEKFGLSKPVAEHGSKPVRIQPPCADLSKRA
ncbi:uncharacterized protein I303_107224 [Kwoniella dejecticola CBS 10117]|uniref:SAP domain-containing protein n=1 Tax=Kwoniella dejecticola CBS 10117 TaxID=1296121 RepID=A0A1A5ZZ27_9TREE|nr:uncharacterized protein I303_06625 [Kwoniella dejecticola CBS 10117]OBR83066.1 hypothetical protein I303_06625 [Kwoniella dejecticola CBS 10117]